MKKVSHIIAILALLTAFLFSLFEISFDPQFSLPGEKRRANPVQEQRFVECFEQRDRAIHERAFGEIDNPDVQKEFITAERKEAGRQCRERFPERLETVHVPLSINLFTLRLRYGK